MSVYALAYCVCISFHDSMLAMRLIAYVIQLPKCLWVKVGLLELERFIEIRALAYLRVANFKPFPNKRICDAFFQIR